MKEGFACVFLTLPTLLKFVKADPAMRPILC